MMLLGVNLLHTHSHSNDKLDCKSFAPESIMSWKRLGDRVWRCVMLENHRWLAMFHDGVRFGTAMAAPIPPAVVATPTPVAATATPAVTMTAALVVATGGHGGGAGDGTNHDACNVLCHRV